MEQLTLALTEVVRTKSTQYTVLEVASTSNPNVKYRVDITNGRCSCPAWKFKRGGRTLCKHLLALGATEQPVPVWVTTILPTDINEANFAEYL
jgi:hypothetical protein